MTNLQIITNEAIAHELYTEEQVKEIFSQGGILPLFTFAEWKRQGYSVKKGEKAKMMCFIWKLKSKTKIVQDKNENEIEVNETNFYKVKAFFFDETQVERLEKVGA